MSKLYDDLQPLKLWDTPSTNENWSTIKFDLDKYDYFPTTEEEKVEQDQKFEYDWTNLKGKEIKERAKKVAGKMSGSQQEFVNEMFSAYQKALQKYGLDPDWAYMLTAVAAFESNWGKSVSGSYNYGGIKVTNKEIKNGVPYTNRMTTDYIPGKGNIKHSQPFRDFASMEDYCDFKVKWLSRTNSHNYEKVFTNYSPDNAAKAWEYVLRCGYGGGSEKNIRNYVNAIDSIVNKIRKYV